MRLRVVNSYWLFGAVLLLPWSCQRGQRPSEMARPSDPPVQMAATSSVFPVIIETPRNQGTLDTAHMTTSGTPAGVACVTCHQAGVDPAANPSLVTRAALNRDFHDRKKHRHGNLACANCHVKDAPSELHLADGTKLQMDQTRVLCAQCHGPQYRDYQHVSHGGMRGYWDLTRGPRRRNDCTACHTPHAPAYPKVIPARAPNDRFIHHKGDT